MKTENPIDYSISGMKIQQAMVDHVKKQPEKDKRTDYILWDGIQVKTSDSFKVDKNGTVYVEILSKKVGVEQGVDLKVNGSFELKHGKKVQVLRTWKDDLYEDKVEYPFVCLDGALWVWNVYKMEYPGGEIVEEKWTGNAGFWVEKLTENERIYHCSHGMADVPDFDSFVFMVKIDRRG